MILRRMPAPIPPVARARKERPVVLTYFYGVLGLTLGLMFLIFFFGLLAAANS